MALAKPGLGACEFSTMARALVSSRHNLPPFLIRNSNPEFRISSPPQLKKNAAAIFCEGLANI
jgi:hypothetical protein